MMEAWSVAVKIRLVDGFTHGLLGFATGLGNSEKKLTALEGRIKSIQRTAAIGIGMTGIGLGILASLKPPLEEAKHFQTEVAKFQTFGLGDAMNAQAVKFAKGAGIVGTSYTDMMRFMVEAQGVFRESGLSGPAALAGAKLAAPMLAKIHFANSALSPEEQGKRDGNAIAMLRFIEMRGGLGDPKRFNQIADAGFKSIQSSGGNVNWEQFRQFLATAGTSARGMNDVALFGQFEPLIGELKGGRAGTGLMTAYNRLEGLTRVPNQVAHDLVKQGLWDGSKVEWNAQGGIKRFLGDPLRDSATLSASPVDFYTKNMLPMYARMKLSDGDMNREDTLIGGRTGGALFALIRRALQTGTIKGSVDSQAKAAGVDGSVAIANSTLAGKQIDLHAKLKNLEEQAGESILPIAISFLSAILPPLKAIADFANAHPKLFGGLVSGITALGIALTVGGAITSMVATAQALGLIFTLFRAGGVAAEVAAIAPEVAVGIEALEVAVGGAAILPFLPIAAGIAAVGAALFGLKWIMDHGEKNAPAHQARTLSVTHGHLLSNSGQGHREAYVPGAHGLPGKGGGVASVYLDGRKVGAVIAPHLVGSPSQRGMSGHDVTMSPSVPGMAY